MFSFSFLSSSPELLVKYQASKKKIIEKHLNHSGVLTTYLFCWLLQQRVQKLLPFPLVKHNKSKNYPASSESGGLSPGWRLQLPVPQYLNDPQTRNTEAEITLLEKHVQIKECINY